MTFVKKGVVIQLGANGEFDDLHGQLPAALERNGRVWLYYAGYDGATWRIGLATSKDGIHFTKKGVVIQLGANGEFDDVGGVIPDALERNGRVWLYCGGHDGAKWRTGLATSKDGIHFTKKGVVVPLGANGEFDYEYGLFPSALERNGRVWLYYTCYDGSKDRIWLATSKDGIHFTKKGVVIQLGANGDFDDVGGLFPDALERNGRVWLYYTGYDGSNERIGLATSKDGIHFTKKGVVIPLGANGDFDDVWLYGPSALERNGRVWLYYTGYDGSKERIGLAISKSGL